jgi:toxin ParE1/3/4
MSLPVERTLEADADLDDIWLRIAVDNVVAADRMISRLEAAEDRLGDFPEIGQARPDVADGLRHWPVPPYLIFYRVGDEAVTIVRIVHGARDLPSLFDA